MTDWEDVPSGSGSLRVQMRMDVSEDRIYTRTSQPNLGEVLEQNTAHRNAPRFTTRLCHSDYVLVARVPEILIHKWWVEEGLNVFKQDDETQARVTKKLNDLEYERVRTAPGRF